MHDIDQAALDAAEAIMRGPKHINPVREKARIQLIIIDAMKQLNTRHTPEGWQSIDTAPTGAMILLADMHAREARYWAFVGWRHNDSASGCVTTNERAQQPATHWMPLAAAPKWGGE